MGGEEKQPYHWTSERIATLCIVVGVIFGVFGTGMGWSLRQSEIDNANDIADVWYSRMENQIEKADYWFNEAETLGRIMQGLAEDRERTAIENLIVITGYNATIFELEAEVGYWELQYQTIQIDHVRLQIAYQDLWELWWNETH